MRFDPYKEHSQTILMNAGVIYRDRKAGRDTDPSISKAGILPRSLGDASLRAMYEARKDEAKVAVAAKIIARVASLMDDIEYGSPVTRVLSNAELSATRVIDHPLLPEHVFKPGGMVDAVRGIASPTETVD